MTNIYFEGQSVELVKIVADTELGFWTVAYRFAGDGPEVERKMMLSEAVEQFGLTVGEASE